MGKLKKIEDQVYIDYVVYNLTVNQIALKYKISEKSVYNIIKKKNILSFNDNEYKAQALDMIAHRKQMLLSIIEDLKNQNNYNLLVRYLKELRLYDELEYKIKGLVTVSGQTPVDNKILILQNIRGDEGSKDTIQSVTEPEVFTSK